MMHLTIYSLESNHSSFQLHSFLDNDWLIGSIVFEYMPACICGLYLQWMSSWCSLYCWDMHQVVHEMLDIWLQLCGNNVGLGNLWQAQLHGMQGRDYRVSTDWASWPWKRYLASLSAPPPLPKLFVLISCFYESIISSYLTYISVELVAACRVGQP